MDQYPSAYIVVTLLFIHNSFYDMWWKLLHFCSPGQWPSEAGTVLYLSVVVYFSIFYLLQNFSINETKLAWVCDEPFIIVYTYIVLLMIKSCLLTKGQTQYWWKYNDWNNSIIAMSLPDMLLIFQGHKLWYIKVIYIINQKVSYFRWFY